MCRSSRLSVTLPRQIFATACCAQAASNVYSPCAEDIHLPLQHHVAVYCKTAISRCSCLPPMDSVPRPVASINPCCPIDIASAWTCVDVSDPEFTSMFPPLLTNIPAFNVFMSRQFQDQIVFCDDDSIVFDVKGVRYPSSRR